MTVQNKIYEGLAMAKPVITGDSPAVRRNLTPGENIWVCRREDPQALAEAIRTLFEHPDRWPLFRRIRGITFLWRIIPLNTLV